MRDPFAYGSRVLNTKLKPKLPFRLNMPFKLKQKTTLYGSLGQQVHFSVRLITAKDWEACPPLQRDQTLRDAIDGEWEVYWSRSAKVTSRLRKRRLQRPSQELRLLEAEVNKFERLLLETWLADQEAVIEHADEVAEVAESAPAEEEVIDEKVSAIKRKTTETIIGFLRPLLNEVHEPSDACMYQPKPKKRFLCF